MGLKNLTLGLYDTIVGRFPENPREAPRRILQPIIMASTVAGGSLVYRYVKGDVGEILSSLGADLLVVGLWGTLYCRGILPYLNGYKNKPRFRNE